MNFSPVVRALLAALSVASMANAALGQDVPEASEVLRSRDWIKTLAKTTLAETFQAVDGTTLPYRLSRPTKDAAAAEPVARFPLVLCLHAAGGRGVDNVGNIRGSQAFLFFAQERLQKQFPCYLVAPQCPDGKRWVATPWKNGAYSVDTIPMTAELAAVTELVDALCRTESVDTSRLYVVGQSMGGFGAFDLLMRRPGRFAAGIVSCGAADLSKAGVLSQVPLWFFHGEDDTTVPFAASRDLDGALRAAGAKKHRFTSFPGVGHGSYVNTFETDGLAEWLFSQRNGASIP